MKYTTFPFLEAVAHGGDPQDRAASLSPNRTKVYLTNKRNTMSSFVNEIENLLSIFLKVNLKLCCH